MNLQLRGTILVALSGLLFGSMAFFGTHLFYLDFSVGNMLFWRFLVASLWIFAMAIIFKPHQPKKTLNNPTFIFKVFMLSALSYSGASALYFLAAKHIGTGVAMVIFFSFPLFVALFSWALGTWKMNRVGFAALLAVVLGLFLLKGSGTRTLDGIGVGFAILAACCFAAYVYGSQHTTKTLNSQQLTLMVCVGNMLIFLMLSYYENSFKLPSSINAWFYICALGIFSTALPIQLLLNGLKYISPVKASILSILEPVVTIMIGLVFLNESISYTQFLGIFIMLLGAVLIQFEKTDPGSSYTKV